MPYIKDSRAAIDEQLAPLREALDSVSEWPTPHGRFMGIMEALIYTLVNNYFFPFNKCRIVHRIWNVLFRPKYHKVFRAARDYQNWLSVQDDQNVDGILNYTITLLINEYLCRTIRYRQVGQTVGLLRSVSYKLWQRHRWSLSTYCAVGAVDCVLLEFYRRRAAKYEDRAAGINGDIPCYADPFMKPRWKGPVESN